MKNFLQKQSFMTYLYLGWLVSIFGLLMSLYYSEVLALVPCSLCWYQRIMFYPTFFIFMIGIVLRDYKSAIYNIVLSSIGLSIALFHIFLQWGVVTNPLVKCLSGVSCAETGFALFGFLTIPMQAALGFLAIIVLCVGVLFSEKETI